MRRFRDTDSDYYDEYRDFKRPKKVEKDKSHKHKKSLYDQMENEFEEDDFDVIYDEFDEE